MKKTLLLTLFICFGLSFLSAQTDINLNIFHKLGDEDFELFTSAQNNLGQSFETKRMEYYISEISLIHDGGTETVIEDLYILANADETTSIELGNYDVTQMEAIRFHIGVDEAVNHNDPAAYPANHPLAPQNPSMHWGWASGYRFIAFEGTSGPNLDQTCEIHGLGDQNYHQTELALDFIAADGTLDLNIEADYTRGLEGMELNSGVFNHGFDTEAALIIENFRDYVFSQSENSVSTNNLEGINNFDVYPNPSNGQTTIEIDYEHYGALTLEVQSLLGTIIQTFVIDQHQSSTLLTLEQSGIYFLRLTDEGYKVMTKKLIINK